MRVRVAVSIDAASRGGMTLPLLNELRGLGFAGDADRNVMWHTADLEIPPEKLLAAVREIIQGKGNTN